MLAKLASYTLVGTDATPVEVEVDVSSSSMPKTVLVGLAETAVRESTHRVERAIVNSGYRRPIDRVVINLAPGDLVYGDRPGHDYLDRPRPRWLSVGPNASLRTWVAATPAMTIMEPRATY
jgi:Subunit ChlI of Mg-chelatase